jgi:hypothetical protein
MIPQSSADIGRYAVTVDDIDNAATILRGMSQGQRRLSTPDQLKAMVRADARYRWIEAGTVVRILNYRSPANPWGADEDTLGRGFARILVEPVNGYGAETLETTANRLEIVAAPPTLTAPAARVTNGTTAYADYRADVDKQRARELAAAHARISDAYTKLSNALDNLAYVEGKK